jgi:hypothetical protein
VKVRQPYQCLMHLNVWLSVSLIIYRSAVAKKNHILCYHTSKKRYFVDPLAGTVPMYYTFLPVLPPHQLAGR